MLLSVAGDAPPSDRVRELETWYAQIRRAGMAQLNIDMWEQHGAAHASDEERAAMAAELTEASRQRAAATAALEDLVARTRAEAPAELAAWALAHEALLDGFLDVCDDPDGTAAWVARRERAQWGEVRAGARAFVDESLAWVPIDRDRYRRGFGIDPTTLARVD